MDDVKNVQSYCPHDLGEGASEVLEFVFGAIVFDDQKHFVQFLIRLKNAIIHDFGDWHLHSRLIWVRPTPDKVGATRQDYIKGPAGHIYSLCILVGGRRSGVLMRGGGLATKAFCRTLIRGKSHPISFR
jgi:hypothetical protein